MWRQADGKMKETLQKDVDRLVEEIKHKHKDLEKSCDSLIKTYKQYNGGIYPLLTLYPSHALDTQDAERRLTLAYIDDIRETTFINYSVIRDVVNCIAVSICISFLGDDLYYAFKLSPNNFPVDLLSFNITRALIYFTLNYQMADLELSFSYPTGHTFIGVVNHCMRLFQFFGVLILGCSMISFYPETEDNDLKKQSRYERSLVSFCGTIMCHAAASIQYLLLLYGGSTESCKRYVIRHVGVNLLAVVLIIGWLVTEDPSWKDNGCNWLDNHSLHVGCKDPRTVLRITLSCFLMLLKISDLVLEESSQLRFGWSIFSRQNNFSGLYFIMTIATMVGGFTANDANLDGEQFKAITRLAVISFLLSFILSIPIFRWMETMTKNEDFSKANCFVNFLCQNIEVVAAFILGGALVSIPCLYQEEKFPSADSFFLDDVIVFSVAIMVACEILKKAMLSFNLGTAGRLVHLLGYFFLQLFFDQTPAMAAYENNLIGLFLYTSLPLTAQLLQKMHFRESDRNKKIVLNI